MSEYIHNEAQCSSGSEDGEIADVSEESEVWELCLFVSSYESCSHEGWNSPKNSRQRTQSYPYFFLLYIFRMSSLMILHKYSHLHSINDLITIEIMLYWML